eukprot:TRINITY_DN10370_c0_g1_i1.p4 TRINITY_DN10370_c0_g1~~TRINITY_DN10370_c0_g1_i1.p4  ORF type:complete len:169 (-),score=10.07 TRINITY_DN10370_c0_g1_i1:690-1196(-)
MNMLAIVIPFSGLCFMLTLVLCKLLRNMQEARIRREQDTVPELRFNQTIEGENSRESSKLSKLKSLDTMPAGNKLVFMPSGQLMYAKPVYSLDSLETFKGDTQDTNTTSQLTSQETSVILYRTELSLSIQSQEHEELRTANSMLSQQGENYGPNTFQLSQEFTSSNKY